MGIAQKWTGQPWPGLRSSEWAAVKGGDNRRFVSALCSRHGPLGRPLAKDYVRSQMSGSVAANTRLREFDGRLMLGKTGLSATAPDSTIIKWCDEKANDVALSCDGFVHRNMLPQAIDYARARVAEAGLPFPIKDENTKDNVLWAQAMARVFDPVWWRRQVRRLQARKVEAVAREIRLVSARAGIYASDITVQRRKAQKARNLETLKAFEAVNENGDTCTLAEMAKSSVSNPVNRRAELMVRIRGFEECAVQAGHVGLFVTITAPSRFHAVGYKKRIRAVLPNKKFDGSTPRDAQAYLCQVWSQIRAQYSREEIRPYGFRIVEPHHDGTPHWHMWLFVEPGQADRLIEIVNEYGLREDGDEAGAAANRVKVVKIDPEVGSAAGYIAKYVAKNIDGHGLAEDLYGKPADTSAARIDAWASTWGIRQFQQIGGAAVTVWRELRRLRVEDLKTSGDQDTAMDVVECVVAADSADWAAYTLLQGGVSVRRDEQLIRAVYQNKGMGKYFEPVKRLTGVVARGFGEIITRVHEWTIQRAGTEQKRQEREKKPGGWMALRSAEIAESYGAGAVIQFVRGEDGRERTSVVKRGIAPPWTCDNNCTGGGWYGFEGVGAV